MKPTVKGICFDLKESPYYFKDKGIVFYFSSEFYRKKFVNNFETYIEEETFKLQSKYGITINFDLVFMISFYKKIEKRGFLIYDEVNKKEITQSCGFLASIFMY